MNSWEVLCEVDLFGGLHESNAEQLARVYFGSPLGHYRARIQRLMAEYAPEALLPAQVARGVGSSVVDLRKLLLDTDQTLQTFLPKKLLLILATESYAPLRTGQLHSDLFDEEFFDPISSPERLFQIVKRLRAWLKRHKLPVEVLSSKAGYKLGLSSGVSLGLDRELIEGRLNSRADFYALKIRTHFGQAAFSTESLARYLHVSPRSCNRLLKELQDDAKITQIGRGPTTIFKLSA